MAQTAVTRSLIEGKDAAAKHIAPEKEGASTPILPEGVSFSSVAIL